MTKYITPLFSLAIILSLSSFTPIKEESKITVTVTGFESNKGQALIRIFNSKEGFPKDDEKVYLFLKTKIENKQAKITIPLPKGNYAIMAGHDINKNGKVDSNWAGFPKEPIGVSNYPTLSKPSFDKAKVALGSNQSKKVNIKVGFPF